MSGRHKVDFGFHEKQGFAERFKAGVAAMGLMLWKDLGFCGKDGHRSRLGSGGGLGVWQWRGAKKWLALECILQTELTTNVILRETPCPQPAL